MQKKVKIITIILLILIVTITSINILTKGKITGLLGLVNPMDLKSSDVPYTNNSQSTVQGAIDDLYTKANNLANSMIDPSNNFGTPKYYAFGTYKGLCANTDTYCSSYSDFPTTATTPPSGKNVYAAKYEDGEYGVCFKKNGTEHCFRGRNWIAEAQHIQKVFSGANDSCFVPLAYVECEDSNFRCYVDSYGAVRCIDNDANARCYLGSNGYINCTE